MERIILHVDVNNAFLSWSAVWLLKNGYEKILEIGMLLLLEMKHKEEVLF